MQTYIISYPLDNRQNFRIREQISDQGVLVNSLSGRAIMSSSDNQAGRLYMTGNIQYIDFPDGTHAHFTCDEPELVIPEWAVPANIPGGYCRLCFRRSQNDWRVRDESGQNRVIEFVQTYEGVINLDWWDRTSHLYHGGQVFLYDGKALLVPGDFTRPQHVNNRGQKWDAEARQSQVSEIIHKVYTLIPEPELVPTYY